MLSKGQDFRKKENIKCEEWVGNIRSLGELIRNGGEDVYKDEKKNG